MAYYEDLCRIDVGIVGTDEFIGYLQVQIGDDLLTTRKGNFYRKVRVYHDSHSAHETDYNYGAAFGEADDDYVDGENRPVTIKFRLGQDSGNIEIAAAFRAQEFTITASAGDLVTIHVAAIYPSGAKSQGTQGQKRSETARPAAPSPTAWADVEALLNRMAFREAADISRARKGIALLLHADHAKDASFSEAHARANAYLDRAGKAFR